MIVTHAAPHFLANITFPRWVLAAKVHRALTPGVPVMPNHYWHRHANISTEYQTSTERKQQSASVKFVSHSLSHHTTTHTAQFLLYYDYNYYIHSHLCLCDLTPTHGCQSYWSS